MKTKTSPFKALSILLIAGTVIFLSFKYVDASANSEKKENASNETSTPKELKLVNTLENIQAKDVIPLENSLIMIGGNTIYQYNYMENNIELISSFKLN